MILSSIYYRALIITKYSVMLQCLNCLMKVINNYNLLRKVTSRIKILVSNNLSPSSKLRRDQREEKIVIMMKKILMNIMISHNQVRPWRYL
jgi:hypothetical protein